MDLPAGFLDPMGQWIGWLATVIVVIVAVWQLAKKIGQRHFDPQTLFNPWLGGIVALIAFWLMGIQADHGLRLHLLGVAVMTLMFGAAPALLAMLVVMLAMAANGTTAWTMLGPSFAVGVLVPVLVIVGWQRLVYRFLPHHVFVFLFANGFFGAALSLLLGGLGIIALAGATGAGTPSMGALAEVWLPSLLLLSFSEAWLSGMILTLLVVYRPEWVSSFDSREYLSKS